MNGIRLSWRNLVARPLGTALSLLLLLLGVGLITLVLHLQNHLQQQMTNNLAGIDLVVGAKGSPLQLILSSVLHIDNPTGNIALAEAEKIGRNPFVKKAVPLSFGDNYQGYRIVGTTLEYPAIYEAQLADGKWWEQPMEACIGSLVAERLHLKIGDHFHGNHGLDEHGEGHEEHSYRVVGIIGPTQSVVDQLILTATESVWEVHEHEEAPHHHDGENHHDEHHHDETEEHHYEAEAQRKELPHHHEDEDREITALLIQFRNPMGAIQLPRMINENTSMQAALPAYEINRLMHLLGFGIRSFQWLSAIILLVSGISVFISLFTALRERRFEIALMRTYGASKGQVFRLVLYEGIFLAAIGFTLGSLIARIGLWAVSLWLKEDFGQGMLSAAPIAEEYILFGLTLLVGALAALIPAIQALRVDISETLGQA